MKYYAIRKPIKIKGVYTNEDKYNQLKKEYESKGMSYRIFEENQEKEALEWAKVDGIADAQQQVVKIQSNSKKQVVKTQSSNHKEQKIIPKIKSDVEVVFDTFVKKGYGIADIVLQNETISVSLNDFYYIEHSSTYCYDIGYFLNSVNDKVYDKIKREYYNVFNSSKFADNAKHVRILRKSEITYLKDGLLVYRYDTNAPVSSSHIFGHEFNKSIYIPFSAIQRISPYVNWNLNNKILLDDEIIKECKKLKWD